MAQIFDTPTPVVSQQPEDLNVLIQHPSPCVDCLSPTEKLALKVYLLAEELKLAGGTDYTDLATLRQAASCFDCGLSNSRIQTLEIQTILQGLDILNWAGNIEATGIRHAIACMRCLPAHTLKAMELVLNAGLQNILTT